jgi:hypothetical protein
VVSTEYMDQLFRKGFEARLTVNNQLRAGALRSIKGEREQRVAVVNKREPTTEYLPAVNCRRLWLSGRGEGQRPRLPQRPTRRVGRRARKASLGA